MSLAGKTVVLGVCGSIAAYKAIYLARLCMDAGAQVFAVLTPGATQFVGPLSFSAITGHPAVTDLWSPALAGDISHVELAHRADVLAIAPASANTLARLAQGRTDDPLCAVALSSTAPMVFAPAMETGMWHHPATQVNVQTLRQRGALMVEPTAGYLASGRSGEGRMAEPSEIVQALLAATSPKSLQGVSLLVTAGPTREAIDPARFLSNPSTGKMGFAIAQEAHRQGADVTLISGPTHLKPPSGVKTIAIQTTEELLLACSEHVMGKAVLVMAAAPCDFRPRTPWPQKRKKSAQGQEEKLDLIANPDILKTLKARSQGVLTVGFAAETEHLERFAQQKLQDKNLDIIVANDISAKDAGFAVDTNRVTIINAHGGIHRLPLLSKEMVAKRLIESIAATVSRPQKA